MQRRRDPRSTTSRVETRGLCGKQMSENRFSTSFFHFRTGRSIEPSLAFRRTAGDRSLGEFLCHHGVGTQENEEEQWYQRESSRDQIELLIGEDHPVERAPTALRRLFDPRVEAIQFGPERMPDIRHRHVQGELASCGSGPRDFHVEGEETHRGQSEETFEERQQPNRRITALLPVRRGQTEGEQGR